MFFRSNVCPLFLIPSPNFGFPLPWNPKIRPPYLSPSDVFSKKLTYVSSSALNDQFSGEKRRLISKTAVRQQKNAKSAVFARLWPFFSKIVGAPPFLRWGVFSLQGPHRSTQNCNRKWAFLKKSTSSRDMRVFLWAFWGNISKNGQFWGGGFGKTKKAKFCPLKKSLPLLDSEFNVDYGFSIKHDPIQSDDWVMDISTMPKLRRAPQHRIIS